MKSLAVGLAILAALVGVPFLFVTWPVVGVTGVVLAVAYGIGESVRHGAFFSREDA